MLSDRFSCPLSPFFRTFNLAGQDHNGFLVMTESRQAKLIIKPNVVGCCSSVFLPETLTLVTRLTWQKRPLFSRRSHFLAPG